MHCISSAHQSPKKLRNDDKVTPRQGYLRFGLPVQFLQPTVPTRAPSRGLGVDACILGWRYRGLCHWPFLHPQLWGSPRLLLRDFLRLPLWGSPCLLLGDFHRLFLGNFLPSHRLFLYTRAGWRHLRARWRSHWNFIVIRPLKHHGPSRPSGLVTTKRDAARLEGSGTRRLSLLPGWLVCRYPLPLNLLRHRGWTLQRDVDGSLLRLRRWSGIYYRRPITPRHSREVHRSFLRMDLRISELVHCSAMTKDKKH